MYPETGVGFLVKNVMQEGFQDEETEEKNYKSKREQLELRI